MAAACGRVGRSREDVRLMGVSKMHAAEALMEAAAAGVKLFGENRVQEFEVKRERLRALHSADAQFHFIGHLQSNKSATAALGATPATTGTTNSTRRKQRPASGAAACGPLRIPPLRGPRPFGQNPAHGGNRGNDRTPDDAVS